MPTTKRKQIPKRKCKFCHKVFQPKKTSQLLCKEECIVKFFDSLSKKSRAIARQCAFQLGYKSMSEVRFAVKLRRKGIKFEYEPKTFFYQMPPQKYTPDYRICIGKNVVYIEYKGKLDSVTRRILKLFKAQYPDVDLRLVFEKPNNKISKTSQTRYFEWAEGVGYKWYNIKDINPLLKELIHK